MSEQEPNSWGQQLRDAILDNSAIRDGLSDTEAQPLIDWGLGLAIQVTATLGQHAEVEVRYEELYGALPKLLTRITWVAVHRQKKGVDWTTRTLNQLNELNQTLHGETAPQISTGAIMGYANQMDGLDKGALVLDLIRQLSKSEEGELS